VESLPETQLDAVPQIVSNPVHRHRRTDKCLYASSNFIGHEDSRACTPNTVPQGHSGCCIRHGFRKPESPLRRERREGLLLTCIAPKINTNADTDVFKSCTLAARTLDDVMHTFVQGT
jgi:hypothetical protein